MIQDVDACLRALIRDAALRDGEASVVFDAPTTAWAARRTAPVVDAFLYDLREDVGRREAQARPERDVRGRIVGRRRGVRYFRLSYLLTAWTSKPEDEHRLLGQLLEALLPYDEIPGEHLRGRLRDEQVLINLALPPGPERSLSDLWNALGGEMKPSLDLVVVVPVQPARLYPVGKPVTVGPKAQAVRHTSAEIVATNEALRAARHAPATAAGDDGGDG